MQLTRKALVSGLFIAGVCTAGLANASDLMGVMNSASVYGNLSGITNSGGNSSGGLGVKGSIMTCQGWLLSAEYHHDFSSLIQSPYQNTGGSMTGINVKGGYLFPFSSNFRAGAFVEYQYTHFGIDFNTPKVQGASLSNSNNALGGGVMAAYGAGPLVLTGDVAYLGGISATDTLRGNGEKFTSSTSSGSANAFELGLQANYQISGPWYALVGFKYDKYMNGGGNLDLLQGNVGLGYSF